MRLSPKPGAFTATQVKGAAELIDYQSSQRFALYVLRDDEQLCALLNNALENGQNVLNVGYLLIGNEDIGVVEYASILSVSVTIYAEA